MNTHKTSADQPVNITFIGLGVMGFPMAGHLTHTDNHVSVYNRTEKRALEWASQFNGQAFKSLQESVTNADVVITCIGKDEDLLNVFLEEHKLFDAMKKNALIIDHTTASSTVAKHLYKEAKKRELDFVDAPISGGEQGAINGQLTIMMGGDSTAVDKAINIVSAYAKATTHMGPSGSGQLTKMVNQITIAGLIQSLSEGLAFAEKAGLDQHKVIEVISKGAAQSWQMDNRASSMIEGHYDHGFAVDLMRKDLGICLAEARTLGATLPVAALVDQFYAEVQNMGGHRWDTSSLLKRLK
jgi:3-hydroxyisobutyrate dehydrogenase